MPSPILYLIRHGEKPEKDSEGQDRPGLAVQGLDRSKALVQVFGASSPYNIGCIIAQKPKEGQDTGFPNGDEARPYLTVKPLAESLGDAVNFIHNIKRDDADKVAHAVKKYDGLGNILICWEHKHLTDIARAIGVSDPPEYPSARYDLIWTVTYPYDQITSITSEQCQGLDEKYKDDKWVQTDGRWEEKSASS